MAVVRAVSALKNREPDQLQPFGDVLDPDALDSIFGSHYDGRSRIGGHVSFVYGSCHVTVDHGEYLTVEKLQPGFRRGPDEVGGSEN